MATRPARRAVHAPAARVRVGTPHGHCKAARARARGKPAGRVSLAGPHTFFFFVPLAILTRYLPARSPPRRDAQRRRGSRTAQRPQHCTEGSTPDLKREGGATRCSPAVASARCFERGAEREQRALAARPGVLQSTVTKPASGRWFSWVRAALVVLSPFAAGCEGGSVA